MRVPFIAAWAKPNAENPHQQRLPIAIGEIQSQVASVMDLFPTLLAFTDSRRPDGHVVDGGRLDALLAGRADPTRREQFLMHYPHGHHRSDYFTVLREGDWKVVYHTFPDRPPLGGKLQSGGARYELFNLAEDPFESNNLATKSPGQLKRMMSRLGKALSKHRAVYPVNDDGEPLKPEMP